MQEQWSKVRVKPCVLKLVVYFQLQNTKYRKVGVSVSKVEIGTLYLQVDFL